MNTLKSSSPHDIEYSQIPVFGEFQRDFWEIEVWNFLQNILNPEHSRYIQDLTEGGISFLGEIWGDFWGLLGIKSY